MYRRCDPNSIGDEEGLSDRRADGTEIRLVGASPIQRGPLLTATGRHRRKKLLRPTSSPSSRLVIYPLLEPSALLDQNGFKAKLVHSYCADSLHSAP